MADRTPPLAAGAAGERQQLARSMHPLTLTLSPWEAERGYRAAQNSRHAYVGIISVIVSGVCSVYYSIVLPPVFHVFGATMLLTEARGAWHCPARRWRCPPAAAASRCSSSPESVAAAAAAAGAVH
jgi:hypothetical protein